jgi:DNA polymerase-3 subunit epsilon
VALDFTAIDFETANSSSASACAVGLARVRDGRVVETAGWLIKPRPATTGSSS